MGVKDAEIKDVVTQLNGDYSIYGANFTKQSKCISMMKSRIPSS